jgi:nitrite reductase (NAD(P)H)
MCRGSEQGVSSFDPCPLPYTNCSSFGLIATEKGFNLFVAGNGGASPKHSELLAKDVPPDEVVTILDRYLMFYIRTADKLQRTARWLEKLPGGMKYLREVILEDKLGICKSLEEQMEQLVGTFHDEWLEVIRDPEKRKLFNQFANTDETVENMEVEDDRGQKRPVYWNKESAKEDFRNTKWTSLTWQPMIEASYFKDADDSPNGKSANIKRGDTQLAVFKVKGKYYATQQMCPHKRAFVLSDGLIGDDLANNKLWVSCPYHKRNYELGGEQAGRCTNDEEVSIATFPVEEREDGMVYLKLPPVHELDGVLGTSKWMVKKGESGDDPFKKLDDKFGGKPNMLGMKGRKPWTGTHMDAAHQQTVKVGGGLGGGSIDW